jgi:tRNA pseudouridine38-40 synthase
VNRIAVGLEYDGTGFVGWQTQRSLRTVQGLAEAALSQVANEAISLVCAGRTDAGVHAREQIAHFDTTALRTSRGWMLGANTNLPPDISVAWAREVPAHFHARYSAESRAYRYFIFNRNARSALTARRATHVHKPLDHDRMEQAAAYLVGEHDFSAFRSSECQAHSPIRRLYELTVRRTGDWVVIDAHGNAFLHHMVRNIAGLLIFVGHGDAQPEWAGEVLAGRDRTKGAPTAPPDGLYLWRVRYPAAFGLPSNADDAGRSVMIAGSLSAQVE